MLYQLSYSYTPDEHDSYKPLITVPDFYRWRNVENNSVLTITKIKTEECKTACRVIRNTVRTTAVVLHFLVLQFSARTFGPLNSSPEISGHAFHCLNDAAQLWTPQADGRKEPKGSIVDISQFLDHLSSQIDGKCTNYCHYFLSQSSIFWCTHQRVRRGIDKLITHGDGISNCWWWMLIGPPLELGACDRRMW